MGLAFLGGFTSLIGQVEMGFDNTDLAKRGAYSAIGIEQMYEHVFSQHSSEVVVFGIGVDYLRDQRALLDVHQALKDSKWSAYGTTYGRTGANANTWLTNMYQVRARQHTMPFLTPLARRQHVAHQHVR